MSLFLSKYPGNIDKKGRISVPVSFRSIILAEKPNTLVLYPSIKSSCIEACSFKRLEHMGKVIATLDPYSEERDAFETIVFGQSVQLAFDGEGRIVIPKFLNEYAGIKDQVIFIGKGEVFEIWETSSFDKYLNKAKSTAIANKNVLKNL